MPSLRLFLDEDNMSMTRWTSFQSLPRKNHSTIPNSSYNSKSNSNSSYDSKSPCEFFLSFRYDVDVLKEEATRSIYCYPI